MEKQPAAQNILQYALRAVEVRIIPSKFRIYQLHIREENLHKEEVP